MCVLHALMSTPHKLAAPTDARRRCLSVETGAADDKQLSWEKQTVFFSLTERSLQPPILLS